MKIELELDAETYNVLEQIANKDALSVGQWLERALPIMVNLAAIGAASMVEGVITPELVQPIIDKAVTKLSRL